MRDLPLKQSPEAGRNHPAPVYKGFFLRPELHKEYIDEHLQLGDKEKPEHRDREKAEDVPSQPVAEDLGKVGPEAL